MKFHVTSKWIDTHSSVSRCKNAEILLDTALEGNEEATDESDDRLELLHKNVKKYRTVFNTVSAGTKLNGTLRRRYKRLSFKFQITIQGIFNDIEQD